MLGVTLGEVLGDTLEWSDGDRVLEVLGDTLWRLEGNSLGDLLGVSDGDMLAELLGDTLGELLGGIVERSDGDML